jgi:hypothetical protein
MVKSKHTRLLRALFEESVRAPIAGRDIKGLLLALGAEVSEGRCESHSKAAGRCFIGPLRDGRQVGPR